MQPFITVIQLWLLSSPKPHEHLLKKLSTWSSKMYNNLGLCWYKFLLLFLPHPHNNKYNKVVTPPFPWILPIPTTTNTIKLWTQPASYKLHKSRLKFTFKTVIQIQPKQLKYSCISNILNRQTWLTYKFWRGDCTKMTRFSCLATSLEDVTASTSSASTTGGLRS